MATRIADSGSGGARHGSRERVEALDAPMFSIGMRQGALLRRKGLDVEIGWGDVALSRNDFIITWYQTILPRSAEWSLWAAEQNAASRITITGAILASASPAALRSPSACAENPSASSPDTACCSRGSDPSASQLSCSHRRDQHPRPGAAGAPGCRLSPPAS